jgi:hypothetical protein
METASEHESKMEKGDKPLETAGIRPTSGAVKEL